MKKLIFPFMLLLMIVSVNAYDVNDTIRINAEYRENGILTESTANVSIYLPSGSLDLTINMTEDGVGLFHYDYVIPDYEGEYTALVSYYKLGVYQGNETQTFDVGDVNYPKWGTCPTTAPARTNMYIVIGLLVIIGFIGLFTKMKGLLFLSGLLLLFSYLIIGSCGGMLWIVTTFLGLAFLMIVASMKD